MTNNTLPLPNFLLTPTRQNDSRIMYCSSSNETHLKKGVEKPCLYKTPSTRVKCATQFLTFIASHLSLGSSPTSRFFITSNAHSGAPGLIFQTSIPTAGTSIILVTVCSRKGNLPIPRRLVLPCLPLVLSPRYLLDMEIP